MCELVAQSAQRPRPFTSEIVCVMVGPDPQEQGGVSSVIRAYREGGLFASGAVQMLASFRAGSGPFKLLIAFKALLRYIGWLVGSRAPVLHVHVSSHGSFWRKCLFIWLALLTGRRVVFQLHGGMFRSFVQDDLAEPLRRFALYTIGRCHLLLCLGTPVLNWFREVVPTAPAMWWPNPVTTDYFMPASQVGTGPREPIVLFLGSLLADKGVSELLDAFAGLHASDSAARLVLGGTGAKRPALEAAAAQRGLSGAVVFLGWIDGAAKIEWLKRARVLALPSYVESQPMVLLEAMASGAVVVCTCVGGVPDLVRQGITGVLAPPRDSSAFAEALCQVWFDVDMRCRIARAARLYVEQVHHIDRVGAELGVLYSTLAAGR